MPWLDACRCPGPVIRLPSKPAATISTALNDEHLLILQNQSLPVAASRLHPRSMSLYISSRPNPGLIEQSFQLIGVLWFGGYLFAACRRHGRSPAMSSHSGVEIAKVVSIRLARLYR